MNDPIKKMTALSSGAFGTHFWVDPKEKVVAVLMTQTSQPGFNTDFENAVMQTIVEPVESRYNLVPFCAFCAFCG